MTNFFRSYPRIYNPMIDKENLKFNVSYYSEIHINLSSKH